MVADVKANDEVGVQDLSECVECRDDSSAYRASRFIVGANGRVEQD